MEDFDLFENLYRRFFSKAYRAAYLVAQDENVAQDSVQEAFLAACEILKKGPVDLSRFQALISAIATKKAADLIRNKAKYVLVNESFLDKIVSLNTDAEVSYDTIEDAEKRMDLNFALKQLDPIYRQILVLKYYNDLSENEISKYLGVPVGTVKSRLYRARMFLRNFLIEQNDKYFQGATWQRCQTHFMRNILDKTPKALQKEIHAKVRTILEAPDAKTARMLLNQVLEEYRAKAPKAMDILESGFEDAIAVLEFPERYRKRLRTTNGKEAAKRRDTPT